MYSIPYTLPNSYRKIKLYGFIFPSPRRIFATSIEIPHHNLIVGESVPLRTHSVSGLMRPTSFFLRFKQGIHPKIVSEHLGHSSIGITLDTYSYVLPGMQEAAMQALDNAMFNPPAATQENKKSG